MSEVLGGRGPQVFIKKSLLRAKYKDQGLDQLGKELKGGARVRG